MPLTIRRFEKTDLNDLYEILSDEETMRFLEAPYSPAKTEAFLNEAALIHKPLIYAVTDAGSFIGYIIYHEYDETSCEAGWVLKKEARGKGYADALTERMISMAEQEGKDLVIECVPSQEATRHIALKHGFVYEGEKEGLDVYRRRHREP